MYTPNGSQVNYTINSEMTNDQINASNYEYTVRYPNAVMKGSEHENIIVTLMHDIYNQHQTPDG